MEPQQTDTTNDPLFQVVKEEFWQDQKADKLARLTPNKIDNKFKYLLDSKVDWKSKQSNFDDQMERYEPDTMIEAGSTEFAGQFIEKGSLSGKEANKIPPALVKIAITQLVDSTGIISIDTNSIAYNSTGWVILTITDTVDANRCLFAIAEATAYEDTVAAAKFVLTNPALNRMHLFTHFDILTHVVETVYVGKAATYFYAIHNDDSTPTAHTYRCFMRMRFIGRAAQGAAS